MSAFVMVEFSDAGEPLYHDAPQVTCDACPCGRCLTNWSRRGCHWQTWRTNLVDGRDPKCSDADEAIANAWAEAQYTRADHEEWRRVWLGK